MRAKPAVLAAAIVSCVVFPAAPAAADVVGYQCTTTATGEKLDVNIDVVLTVPAQATVDEEMTIGWRGTYVTGAELIVPATGLEGEINMYVYAGISGIEDLTSATGVAPLGTVIPGETVPLPETAQLKTTPGKADEGTVHAASINFGPRPQERLIECEVKDKDALTEYPLTVVGADGGTPTPDDSPSPSPDDTGTETSDPETSDPETTEDPETTDTPSGGVSTGGGGEAGPDGRAVMVTGLVVVLAAATGLRLRRPRRTA
ncbi:hypothetical protein [Nonomuraea sp. NPDC049709]|uniref:hypothetical protein n=1 Tax=Nonomuraea sp. NPDC049709 TaxID=3154736 RepID=UPI003422217F